MSFLKSLFGKQEITPNLFIHVPKCGGSTFVGMLKDSVKLNSTEKATPTHKIEKIGNTEIKHVDFSVFKRPFKSPEIFLTQHKSYLKYNLFLLVRNPADRVYSEFNFQFHILDNKSGNPTATLYARLKPKPKSFVQYYKNAATQNYQCKFLLGRKLADPTPVNQQDFERIISAIEKLNIHCGVTDQYAHFLSQFVSITGTKLKNSGVRRKQTPGNIKKVISPKDKENILKLNKFDTQLYNYVLDRINGASDSNRNSYTIKDQNDFVV